MRLTRGQARVDVGPVGAIISDAVFHVDGRSVRPFFQNPWRDDPRDMDDLTRHLGCEWACVPFGTPQPPPELPADWDSNGGDVRWHRHAHGFGAHHAWTLTRQDASTAIANVTYPPDGPIAGLRRRISLVSETEIQLRLDIDAREDTKLPVGLHPVLSLADAAPQSGLITVAGQQTAWTFPRDVEPGRSYLAPDQRGVPLAALSTSNGGFVHGAHVPFPAHSEDLVFLPAPGGRVSLTRPDRGYRVDVTWDDTDLPSCLLWLSNRGRDYAPWDGRVCAVGIEPVAAAFDLGIGHSVSATTPLARKGIRTTVNLRAGETWHTSYAISIHKVADDRAHHV